MKLVYLANVRIPTEKAHGVQIMKMCEAFVRAGVDLRLIAARRENARFASVDPFAYYRIGPDVRFPIERLWLVDMVMIERSLRGLSVLIQNASFALVAFFRLWRTDALIYCRDASAVFALALIGKPIVLVLHTMPRRGRKMYSWVFSKMQTIVVITEQLSKALQEWGVSKEKILVAPDGVDPVLFAATRPKGEVRTELGLPLHQPIVVYAGHLYAWKGVFTLIDTATLLPHVEFVLVGGMPADIERVQERVRDLQLRNVRILGHRWPEEVPKYLHAADCVVIPNSAKKAISKLYTSPLKVFESMAAGTPIVASDLPSLREVLNEHNAVLVIPDSAQSIAEGIQHVLSDSSAAQGLARQAQQDVAKYAWIERARGILTHLFS